jgi:hypothetical protein|tara:strand:- start:299 stop:607 length:309 start_codon:yes stop_codon:yes gene_type:complete
MKNKYLLLVLLILYSCSSFKDVESVLRNEKMKSTDEFLVKKKEPLVLPPDYREIPTPGSINQNQTKDDSRIKKILKSNKEKKSDNKKGSSSVEETILNQIRK